MLQYRETLGIERWQTFDHFYWDFNFLSDILAFIFHFFIKRSFGIFFLV